MTAFDELGVVAAEEGWTPAVPLHLYAVYIRDELIVVVELSDPDRPGFVWLQSGARRWEVNAPGAVLETALAWLRRPYDTVLGDLEVDVDAALARMRADLTAQILGYAVVLENTAPTGLIGATSVASRLREIVPGALQSTEGAL